MFLFIILYYFYPVFNTPILRGRFETFFFYLLAPYEYLVI